MNSKDRLWSLGAGLIAIGVAVGAWFGAISPDLAAADSARGDLENVEHQNSLHELRIVQLEEAAARMDEFEADRAELAVGVPGELRYPEFLRQLDALAVEAGVTIVGVTQSEAVAYAPPVEAVEAAAPEAAPAAGAESAGATADTAQADTAQADTAAAVETVAEPEVPVGPMPHTDERVGPQNLSAVQITVSATGDPIALQEFLHELQMGSRLVSISSAAFAEGTESLDGEAGETPWKADISGFLYVLQPESTTP